MKKLGYDIALRVQELEPGIPSVPFTAMWFLLDIA